MEVLADLASKNLKTGILYVMWTRKHRITIIFASKADKRGQYTYSFTNVDKYFIPKIFRYYRTSHFEETRTVQVQKPLKSKFVKFNGRELMEFPSKPPQCQKYKDQKYLDDILNRIKDREFMDNWLYHPQTRYKMQYQTLHFLANSDINPSISNYLNQQSQSSKGFSEKVKTQVIHDFQVKESKLITYKSHKILLIKDVVGLWTTDLITKRNVLVDVDCISSYDVEHIVSNSYGVDNTDHENAVLLDSSVNRKKGNQMLFLANDECVAYIRKKIIDQEQFLGSLRPWYKRWL